MPARPRNKGLTYFRRSSDRQEASLEVQLEWACKAASEQKVPLVATLSDLRYMQANKLISYKDIRLDDSVSGGDLQRPGFLALNADALANKDISHLFIYKRDRFGRPEDALEMVRIEKKLLLAGITVVLSGEIALPMDRGIIDPGRDVSMLFAYCESGQFLMKLAENVLRAHRQIALAGFRTGGNAPYGFVRVLVNGAGEVLEELVPGRRVRQAGCHVRAIPKDPDKIAVWLYLLELKHQGWGKKRIAKHLNDLGIASPGAGTVRTDQGIRHLVSGKWNANTVGELCSNRAILGLQDYGKRSEGKYRRLGVEGPRLLTETDRDQTDKPRMLMNESSVIITAKTGIQPLFDVERWHDIQHQIQERGKNQRGIPRCKDPSKYPLGCGKFLWRQPGNLVKIGKWAGDVLHTFKHEGYQAGWEKLLTWRTSLRGRAKRRAADTLLKYVGERHDMILYPEFEAKGWQIGSGPTEATCKTLTARLKGSGMRWESDNGEAIMALEALAQSGQWKLYWQTRLRPTG